MISFVYLSSTELRDFVFELASSPAHRGLTIPHAIRSMNAAGCFAASLSWCRWRPSSQPRCDPLLTESLGTAVDPLN